MTVQSNPYVDAYIEQFPALTKERLKYIRKIIKKTFPTAIEDISYNMPAYRLHEKKMPVVFFGGYEKHVGIYAVPSPDEKNLYHQIEPYITGKGTLSFKHNEPLPVILIERVLANYYIKLLDN